VQWQSCATESPLGHPSGGPQHGNGLWRNCRGRQSRAGREWTGALAPVLGCIDATPRSAPVRQMTRPVLGPKVFSPGDVKRFFYIYIIYITREYIYIYIYIKIQTDAEILPILYINILNYIWARSCVEQDKSAETESSSGCQGLPGELVPIWTSRDGSFDLKAGGFQHLKWRMGKTFGKIMGDREGYED